MVGKVHEIKVKAASDQEGIKMPYYMHELNPDYNPATRLIRHMQTTELQMLLNNDELIETLVQELQQVKTAESERNAMLESNKNLAESNLAMEPVLNDLRIKVLELNDEVKVLKESLETKKQKLDDLTRQMSLDTTLALIQAAAAEAEEESEAISENFISGEMEVEPFLDSYLHKRKLTHLRRVKAEKMAELLNQFGVNRSSPPPSRASSSINNPPYPHSYRPYPYPSQDNFFYPPM
ncbi:vacuolar protein sorting-associated protein 37B [Caerostris darwini]|uniref:Vacuolar protein sorting-associated protein 37B n=1 Tax=Caerostris darwini TaxID=1538125 RepID=A0AAV4UQS8_9ARAC|nr:vacuolar protein sorting-associated protein 37B [Caerostris darwini]